MQGLPQHYSTDITSRKQSNETPTLGDAYEGDRYAVLKYVLLLHVSMNNMQPSSTFLPLLMFLLNTIFRVPALGFQQSTWLSCVRINQPMITELAFKSSQYAGKSFVPPYEDTELKLGGLLALNLHEFSSDVEEIADQVHAFNALGHLIFFQFCRLPKVHPTLNG